MGFLDKIKKTLGSKNEDVESQNSEDNIVNEEIIDKPTFTESRENEDIQSEDSKETPINEEIIDKPTLNDKIRNFKYLDDLIHSGVKEIVLDSDIILDNDEESEYEGGIELDMDNFIIDGNGYAIDACGKTDIFLCTGKNVTIKNIILKNGCAKIHGGAIYNTGELTITDSVFSGNTAQGRGGAIQTWKGKLTIISSTFTGNTANRGGAIHNSSELIIKGSTLMENRAVEDGGAIANTFNGEIILENCEFIGNKSSGSGGAISNYNELTITESTFTGNTSRSGLDGGGAIYNNRGKLTITESTFTENNADWNDGGAIYNKDSELTITESTFTENTAKWYGGAINNNLGNLKIFNCEFSSNKSPNNIILNYDSLQVHNTTFKDNQSKDIILNDGDKANLGIFTGEFKENNVEKSVLCNNGRFCSVERTMFENNISNNTMNNIINESELILTNPEIKDQGKSILNQNYILIRKSPPELENAIYGEGIIEVDKKIIPQGESFDFGYLDKKIHESDTKEIILEHDITFENYERDFYEGGIELDIDNLIIDGNGRTINGAEKSRIFIITGKNITLKNIIFKNGHTHKNYDNPLNNNCGAIKIYHTINITIENCKFINNTSEEDGGAILNYGELTITESSLNNNTAESGGAILNYGELTITESSLNNNTAESGGAIHNNHGKLTITGSTFTENTAKKGGAISNRGELTIIESALTENTVQGTHENDDGGGAIYNYEGELTITESTLNNNKARTTIGGAIHNRDGELTITESRLAENAARRGGAIENWKGDLTIIGSTLQENTAVNGGAIRNGGKLTIGKLTIIESTFNENEVYWSGGAIHNKNGELTIQESAFIKNTAKQSGGGAISNQDGELIITESTLTENTAVNGGAICNLDELTITGSTLQENTADNRGGAIHNKNEKSFNITNCKLENNKPDDIN